MVGTCLKGSKTLFYSRTVFLFALFFLFLIFWTSKKLSLSLSLSACVYVRIYICWGIIAYSNCFWTRNLNYIAENKNTQSVALARKERFLRFQIIRYPSCKSLLSHDLVLFSMYILLKSLHFASQFYFD